MPLLRRDETPGEFVGTERALEIELGGLGGFELRPTRVFVWTGDERAGNERLVPLAERPVGLDRSRRESIVHVGPVKVRSRGNPLMTVALAGAIAFRRWAEAPSQDDAPRQNVVGAGPRPARPEASDTRQKA
jgi:hypothetical protein